MKKSDVLYRLSLIRALETTVLELIAQRKIFGTCHPCIGQESSALAIASNLSDGDIITSTHRGHGHYLARFNDPVGLLAEIMGREAGICGGWGGTQHLQANNFYSNGITGGMIPTATGLALAQRLKNTGHIVAAFLGDGALSQGVIYESLNMAGLWELPIVYVVEDNRYAMSTPTRQFLSGDMAERGAVFGMDVTEILADDWDKLASTCARVIASARTGRPQWLIIHTYRLCGHSKSDDECYRTPDEKKIWEARDPLTKLQTELGEQGDSIAAAAQADVRHAVSVAEKSPPSRLPPDHGRIVFAPHPGVPAAFRHRAPAGVPSDLTASVIANALDELFRQDDRVYMLGEDIEDPYGGAFRVSRGLSTKYPGRLKNTPISEPGVVGVGTGLALSGLLPIIEIMFGDFIGLAFDQLVNHASKFRGMFGGRARVPLTIRTPMGGRRGYGGTHSQTLEKHFLGVPGLKVVAPSLWHDPGNLLIESVYDPNPVLFIENKLLYGRPVVAPDAGQDGVFALKRNDGRYPLVTASTGEFEESHMAIIAYGGMQPFVAHAAEILMERDIYVDIIVPSRLDTVDLDGAADSVIRAGRVLIVEESVRDWGYGAEWAAQIHESGRFMDVAVNRIGARRLPIGAARTLEDVILPQAEQVVSIVEKMLRKN